MSYNNDASTDMINDWLGTMLGPEFCIVITEERPYFHEFSFMSCPANPDVVFNIMPEFCIIINEEY